MDEQMITKTVEAVVKQMMKSGSGCAAGSHESHGHVCRCRKQKMTLDLAKALIEKIEQKAKSMQMSVIIAVADQAARPVAIHCMDDAYIASFDIACNKAYTSAGLKMSTDKLSRLSQPGGPLYGIQHTNEGKIVIFGGGEPLEIGGKLVGALGVSGGTAEQDTELAAYGKEVFEEVVACL